MTDSSQTIPAKKSGKTARKVIMMRNGSLSTALLPSGFDPGPDTEKSGKNGLKLQAYPVKRSRILLLRMDFPVKNKIRNRCYHPKTTRDIQ
jgi:hypothetical protein